jgi:hypothetical protein
LAPEINPRRAMFVLGKIEETLSWETAKEQEKHLRLAPGQKVRPARLLQHFPRKLRP